MSVILVPEIAAGGAETFQIEMDAGHAWFPVGCALTAHVKHIGRPETVLATLTTANGGLVRVSDYQLNVVLTAAQTATFTEDFVEMDIVRTNLAAPAYLKFKLQLPVYQPVTVLA